MLAKMQFINYVPYPGIDYFFISIPISIIYFFFLLKRKNVVTRSLSGPTANGNDIRINDSINSVDGT